MASSSPAGPSAGKEWGWERVEDPATAPWDWGPQRPWGRLRSRTHSCRVPGSQGHGIGLSTVHSSCHPDLGQKEQGPGDRTQDSRRGHGSRCVAALTGLQEREELVCFTSRGESKPRVRVWGQVLCGVATVSACLRVLLRCGQPGPLAPSEPGSGGGGGGRSRDVRNHFPPHAPQAAWGDPQLTSW